MLRQAGELPPPEAAATVAVTATGLSASVAPAAPAAAAAVAAEPEATAAADLDSLADQYLDAERDLAASAASAASELQLQELLRSGTDTWSSLMASIGRGADELQTEGGLADRMLGEWVREHLLPKPATPTPSTPPPLVTVGTALLATVGAASGRPAARFLLREQFVHKGLLLVLQAHAVHMQCTCSAHAVHMQCICSAHAAHAVHTCSAHAVHMQCTCSAHMQ